MASASCTLFCSASHFLLLIFILLQVENHQCCPHPHNFTNFTCPDNGEFTNLYCEGGGCELSCNANHTLMNCSSIPPNSPPIQVLDMSATDVTIAVDDTDWLIDDHCHAYSLFHSSFPSFRSVTIFKIGLGKKETFFGCSRLEPLEASEGHAEYRACESKKAYVYRPYDKETANTTLMFGGCMQFHFYYMPPTKYSETKDKTKGRRLWAIHIIPPFVEVLAVFMLIALIVYWRRRDSSKAAGLRAFPSRSASLNHTRPDLEEGSANNGVTVFSYAELQEVTNNFDPQLELGEGGFGVVYHGKLKDGREVAVKRMFEKNYRQIEQFKNEIQLLTNVRHPNLVTLYGSTSRHSRELLLVYEYIPNGTLSDHLHGRQSKSALLLWPTRLNIAIQTASALCYLHYKDIIHRDIKSNNILLDKTFVAKVADFGLSRLFPSDVSHVSTAPQGTPGYLDPEYHQCYHLTDRSDVYSFGVVLVELISSREAVDFEREGHEVNLANYAMNRIQGCEFGELVDVNLGYDKSFKVRRMTNLVAELAFRCLQHEREIRPSMEEVLEELKRIESVDYEDLEAEEIGNLMILQRS